MIKNKVSAILPIVATLAISLSVVGNVFAWQKDGGASCTKVFASIKNENQSRGWDGYVKANGVTKVSNSGTATPNQWVTISWTPNAGFVGNVEAYVRIKKHNSNDTDDFKKVTGNLNCAPSPTPSPSPTPNHDCDDDEDDCNHRSPTPSPTPTVSPSPSASPSPTPSVSPSPTPVVSPSPTPNDCGQDCNTDSSPTPSPTPSPSPTPDATPSASPSTGGGDNNSSNGGSSSNSSSSGGQVAGASTGPQVLASTGQASDYELILAGLGMILFGVWQVKIVKRQTSNDKRW